MIRLLVATRNKHKAVEIQAILGEGFHCLTLKDYPGVPEVVEDAETFAGNASKKAMELAEWISRLTATPQLSTPEFVLADDSGLEVDALDGAPGVRSARFAALDTGAPGNSADADNNAKLLQLLKDVPVEKRSARFRCVIVLVKMGGQPERRNPEVQVCEGVCEGRIGFSLIGQGGFGYDPLFTPTGFDQTFAELGEDVKNALSHRAKALAKLREHLPG